MGRAPELDGSARRLAHARVRERRDRGRQHADSWATGGDPSVDSHYQRILAANPAIANNVGNYAQSGSKMIHTDAQAASAIGQHAAYVTLWSGTNDVCTSTVGQMTSVANFTTQLRQTLTDLTTSIPGVRVLVLSIRTGTASGRRST